MKNKAAQELGSLGGKVKSEAKSKAAKINSAKGGAKWAEICRLRRLEKINKEI